MAALKAVSTTSWVCRHIVKTSFIPSLPFEPGYVKLNASNSPYPITRSVMHPARSNTKIAKTRTSLRPMAMCKKNVRPEPAPKPLDSSAIENTLVERTVVTKTGTRSGRCLRMRLMMFPESRSRPLDLCAWLMVRPVATIVGTSRSAVETAKANRYGIPSRTRPMATSSLRVVERKIMPAMMVASRRNVRVRRLYEQGEEMDLERTMPSERISMMWQLALDAYAFKGEDLLDPDFRDILFAF